MRRKHKPTRIRRLGNLPDCVLNWLPESADIPRVEELDTTLECEDCNGAETTEGK